MTEEEARTWFVDQFGPASVDRVGALLSLIVAETRRQNLISPATIDTIWARHAVDSAQLLALASRSQGTWLDIGTGGGFPGLIVALLGGFSVTLVEPRKRRAMFLADCATALDLRQVTVRAMPVEKVTDTADIISARAVASIEKILHAARHCATADTRWILPRGHISQDEFATMRNGWKGMFHVEHSVTSPQSAILILNGLPT